MLITCGQIQRLERQSTYHVQVGRTFLQLLYLVSVTLVDPGENYLAQNVYQMLWQYYKTR